MRGQASAQRYMPVLVLFRVIYEALGEEEYGYLFQKEVSIAQNQCLNGRSEICEYCCYWAD